MHSHAVIEKPILQKGCFEAAARPNLPLHILLTSSEMSFPIRPAMLAILLCKGRYGEQGYQQLLHYAYSSLIFETVPYPIRSTDCTGTVHSKGGNRPKKKKRILSTCMITYNISHVKFFVRLPNYRFTCSVPISRSLTNSFPSIWAELMKGDGPTLKQ